jgi:addiction module HigA family antidote
MEGVVTENEFALVTPGEMLREEFLKEYGLSQNRLAKAIGISPNRIAEIVNDRRRITADTALRLSLYFGNSPEFWLNLQTHYDLKIARRQLSAEAAERIRAHHAALESPLLTPPSAAARAGCRAGRGRGRPPDA